MRVAPEAVCMLVAIRVDDQGRKRFLAVEPDTRESTHSWQRLPHRLAKHGLAILRLAVTDGATGFWATLTKVFPKARQRHRVVHKTRNALNCLPKRLHTQAKKCLNEIRAAPTRQEAERAARRFGRTYRESARRPPIRRQGPGAALASHDFPGRRWRSIRPTNAVESVFATIPLRTRQTRGSNSPATVTGMVHKLAMAARRNWRRLHGFKRNRPSAGFVPFRVGAQQEEGGKCAGSLKDQTQPMVVFPVQGTDGAAGCRT